MKLYLVHFGFATHNGETKPCGAVTLRQSRDEAAEICAALDHKRLDLMYTEYLAQLSRDSMRGNLASVMALHTDEIRGEFLEAIKDEPKYVVTELEVDEKDLHEEDATLSTESSVHIEETS